MVDEYSGGTSMARSHMPNVQLPPTLSPPDGVDLARGWVGGSYRVARQDAGVSAT